jgi:hypothetical protein
MQTALPFVVFGAVGVSVVMSIVFLLSSGSAYDKIGQGGLRDDGGRGSEGDVPEAPPLPGRAMPDGDMLSKSPELQRMEREQEIRQMLQARNERRERRGEPALDIDAELAALTATPASSSAQDDPGIAEEVLQLVVARNERRERQGLEPLDIETEVQRTLAELNP